MATPFERGTWIEEVVDRAPDSVAFLIGRGMKPLACGEPVWETVEGLARSKGLGEDEIDRLVRELNELTGSGKAVENRQ